MNDQRLKWLSGFLVFLLALVLLRLLDLQVIHHQEYLQKSLNQRTRIINLTSSRGDIYDRNGVILATTIDTYSVFSQAGKFSWLARKLPLAEAEQLKAKDPRHLFLLKEKKRLYPKGSSTAQLLGFVGIDNDGLSGVELSWDKYLKGKSGRVVTEGDPQGRELYGALREIEPGEEGMNVYLTIDENIQYIAEREIAAQIKKSRAASGMLFVMDAKSGELLAVASKPDFNPNEYTKAQRQNWHPRWLDPYEPGSTFKVITTASGLDQGVITLETPLQALNQLTIGGKVISNSHQVKWPGATISVSKMLEESINTAVAQIGIKLGPERFYESIRKFGFGTETDSGLAGESRGIVRYWRNWYQPDVAMISFGQSIAVTPLQLLAAFSAFANQGKMVKPFMIKKVESLDGRFVKAFGTEERGQAVSAQTAAQVKILLRNIVLKGSGRRAQMEWFTTGGKTGTAQKAAPGGRGYLKGHFIASFIGLAPLAEPRLVCLVIVDDPRGSIWGESVCGPIFKNVMQYSLRYLNVRPDMIQLGQK